MKINFQGIKDNAWHLAGIVVGLSYLKATGKRYGKEHRGTRKFSTVAANQAANGFIAWAPYAIIIK